MTRRKDSKRRRGTKKQIKSVIRTPKSAIDPHEVVWPKDYDGERHNRFVELLLEDVRE